MIPEQKNFISLMKYNQKSDHPNKKIPLSLFTDLKKYAANPFYLLAATEYDQNPGYRPIFFQYVRKKPENSIKK